MDPITVEGIVPRNPDRFRPARFFSVDAHTRGRGLVVAPAADNEDERPNEDCANQVPGTGGTAGNPIVIRSGNKLQVDTDFVGNGEMPLSLVRTYSSGSGSEPGLFGAGWASNLEHTLSFHTGPVLNPVLQCEARFGRPCAPVAAPTVIVVRTESGRAYRYRWDEEDRIYVSQEGAADPLALLSWIVRTPNGGYTLERIDHSSMTFGADGLVTRITDATGLSWTYTHAPASIRIERSGGRALTIALDPATKVATSVTDPGNNVYVYGYRSALAGAPRHQLATADYPGNAVDTRTYHYEHASLPHHLTGISLGGVRYATFGYYADGRGRSTEHAGGAEKVTLVYGSDGTGSYTDVTNALQLTTRHRFTSTGAVRRLSQVNRPAFDGCPSAAASYVYAGAYVDVSYDWNGVGTDLDYDAAGRLIRKREGITATHPRGLRYTHYDWNSDPRGRLRSVTEGEVDVEAGDVDRIVRITEYRYGDTTTATPTAFGDMDNRIKSIVVTSHVGRSAVEATTFQYRTHADRTLVSTMKEDGPATGTGDTVLTTYSQHGDVLSRSTSWTDALTDATVTLQTTYGDHDGRGYARTITDPNADVVEQTFDGRGRVATATRYYAGTARTSTFEYDRFGNVGVARVPGQFELRQRFDEAGRLERRAVRRYGATPSSYTEDVTTYGYNLLSLQTERRSFRTSIAAGQCTAQPDGTLACTPAIEWTSPVQRAEFRTYDASGRLATVSGARFRSAPNSVYALPIDPVDTTTFGYTSSGRLRSITPPLLPATTFEYDALGRRSAVVDARGKRTSFAYDVVETRAGFVRRFTVTPPSGGATVQTFDGLGLLLQEDSPDSGTRLYTYQAGQRLHTVTHADGSKRTYAYDAIGRIKTITDGTPSASAQFGRNLSTRARGQYATQPIGPQTWNDKVDAFTYDTCAKGRGRLCEATHGAGYGRTRYTYGAYGRLASQTESGTSPEMTVGYRYDTFGRPAGVDYPQDKNGARAIDYGYAGDRLTKIDAVIGGQRLAVVDQIDTWADGMLRSYVAGNGMAWSSDVDLNGRVSALTSGTTQSLGYSYDPAGRVSAITHARDAAATQTYGYGATSRLESNARGGIAEQWIHDDLGNLDHYVRGTRAYDLVYAGNRLTGIAGALNRQYESNSRGDRELQIDDGRFTRYVYDVSGRQQWLFRPYALGSVCEPTSPDLCTTMQPALVEYGSNAAGQRVHKAVHRFTGLENCTPGGYTSTCMPTGLSPVSLTQYLYASDGSLMSERVTHSDGSEGALSNYAWLAGRPIAVIRGNALYHIASDHLGRPEVVTDANTAVVWRARNLAYHREITQRSASFGDVNIGFPGQYFDAESNLYYNWHRYYDPSTARYTQSDPIGLRGGSNTYSYVRSNPVALIDPAGLESEIVIWQPVGWGSSSFGHVSGQVNGRNYSFGPGGWDRNRSFQNYVSNQQGFRSGAGIKLGLTAEQEKDFEECLENWSDEYDATDANCGTPFKDCLNMIGHGIGAPLFPADIGDSLLDSPLNVGTIQYPGPARPWWRDNFFSQ